MFKFIKNPEFVKSGARILFREGRTKGIGQVTQVKLANIYLFILWRFSLIPYFVCDNHSNCFKYLSRCFHLSTMQTDKSRRFLEGFPKILPSSEILKSLQRRLVRLWIQGLSRFSPASWCQLLLSHFLQWNLNNWKNLPRSTVHQLPRAGKRACPWLCFFLDLCDLAQPCLGWSPHKIGWKKLFHAVEYLIFHLFVSPSWDHSISDRHTIFRTDVWSCLET